MKPTTLDNNLAVLRAMRHAGPRSGHECAQFMMLETLVGYVSYLFCVDTTVALVLVNDAIYHGTANSTWVCTK